MKGNKARAPNSQNKMRGKEREREEEDEEGKKMANEKGGKEEKSIELKLGKRGEGFWLGESHWQQLKINTEKS